MAGLFAFHKAYPSLWHGRTGVTEYQQIPSVDDTQVSPLDSVTRE